MSLQIIILAAGNGTRMRSSLPKVLHQVGGVALLEHVIHTAQQLHPQQIFVVYGENGAQLQQQCQQYSVQWVHQPMPLGTADAVLKVLPLLKNSDDQVLILYGDVPFIRSVTLQKLMEETFIDALGILTTIVENPYGLGRILRNAQGEVIAIVEEKDATDEQKNIQEINSGIYLTTVAHLQQWLPRISHKNNQHEYYLTDIIKFAVAEKIPVNQVYLENSHEVLGINDRWQLAQAERYYQLQQVQRFAKQGVTFLDPQRVDMRGDITLAEDVIVDVNVILTGKISIGKNSIIGPNCVLHNVTVGENVTIKPNCVIEGAKIENHCQVGPFARVRPDTHLLSQVKIGNFVEIKNTTVMEKSKIPHLSYIGDAQVGKKVNIGAGVITVNYDGAQKYSTYIHDNAFIGCDSQLIAPITIEENAYIAAGSTITKTAPANQLTLCRAREQVTVARWQRPEKTAEEPK